MNFLFIDLIITIQDLKYYLLKTWHLINLLKRGEFQSNKFKRKDNEADKENNSKKMNQTQCKIYE